MGSQHIKRYAHSNVAMCRETLGPPSKYSMVTAFHPPNTQHINGAQAASRNRGHLHRRCEIGDVEGCIPFERRQQTELRRHVESLLAACWMPHRTRGGDTDLLIAQTAVIALLFAQSTGR